MEHANIPGGRQWQQIGIGDRFWSLERFHGRVVGREAFGWVIQSIFGIDGFHEEQRYLVGICAASWLLQSMVPTFGLPEIEFIYCIKCRIVYLGGQLFSWSFSSSWFTSSLFCTSHNGSLVLWINYKVSFINESESGGQHPHLFCFLFALGPPTLTFIPLSLSLSQCHAGVCNKIRKIRTTIFSTKT